MNRCLWLALLLLLISGCSHASSFSQEDSGRQIETIMITGELVNVREKPGTAYSTVTQLAQGETYELLDHQDDWYEIKLDNGKSGWIADWLAEKSFPTSGKGKVKSEYVNVREKPNTNSQIVGKLKQGAAVNILQEKNGWSQIIFDSSAAWVSSEYIDAEQTSKKQQQATMKHVSIMHDKTRIRKKADITSPIVGEAFGGEVYEILDRKDDWLKVKTNDGKKGYVAGWLATPTDRPVFYRNRQDGLKGKIIIVDAGHGGNDQGAAGQNGTLEKDVTMKTARLLQKKLEKKGATVILTREDDRYVALKKRVAAAKDHAADVFLSIHYDSIEEESATGHTAYYFYPYEKRIGEAVHHALTEKVGARSRGTHFGDYYVLRENTQPSILLELGYLSNPEEEAKIKTKKYRERATDGIVAGLQNYFTK